MKLKLFSLFFVLFFIPAFAQDWTWGIKASGYSQTYKGVELSVDTEGNMVLAGYYQRDFTLGDFSLYTEDDYYSDIYLARINANKEVEWLKHIEAGDSYGENIAITVDDDDNIYLTGSIDSHIFVSKYNSLGNEQWTTTFGEEAYGAGKTISIDKSGNIYISGGHNWNLFIAKLSNTGVPVWIRELSYNDSDAIAISDIIADDNGNIYFTGVFRIGQIVLDNIVLEHDENFGDHNLLWGKIDINGNFVWAKSAHGHFLTFGHRIALSPDNYIYLCGSGEGDIIFEDELNGGLCCGIRPYVAKYNTLGSKEWAMFGFNNEHGGITQDMKLDFNNNMYVTGSYHTGFGVSTTENDIYIDMYNAGGIHQWRKEFKMTTSDYTKSLDFDNNGHCYYTGYNESPTFIDESGIPVTNTLGIAELTMPEVAYKRPKRPKAHNYILCDTNTIISADGNNLRWYDNESLDNLIHEGNEFEYTTMETDTIYVTQTENNIESWPRQVVVNISPVYNTELTYNLQVLSATYNDMFQYEWYYQSNILENATGNSITIEDGTNISDYSVIITMDSCFKRLSIDALSVKTNNNSNISIYPNPATNSITISNIPEDTRTVSVLNLLGQVLFQKDINGDTLTNLDLSSQPKGLYLIQLSDNMHTTTFKVIKQ